MPARASSPANAVHEECRVFRRRQLHDPVDVRNVDPTCRHVRAEKDEGVVAGGGSFTEAVVDGRSLFLSHLSVQSQDLGTHYDWP